MPRRRLVGQENSLGVDVEIGVPIVVGEIHRARHRGDAGIADQEVVAAPVCLDRGETGRDGGAVAHIKGERQMIGSEFCHDGVRPLAIQVGYRHADAD